MLLRFFLVNVMEATNHTKKITNQINRCNWVVITVVNLPEMLCWGPLPFCWGCCCAESVLKSLGSPILPITSFAGLSTVNSITISTFLWRKKKNMRITKYFESQRLAFYWVTSLSWVSSWFKGNRGQIEMRLSSQTMDYFVLYIQFLNLISQCSACFGINMYCKCI